MNLRGSIITPKNRQMIGTLMYRPYLPLGESLLRIERPQLNSPAAIAINYWWSHRGGGRCDTGTFFLQRWPFVEGVSLSVVHATVGCYTYDVTPIAMENHHVQ